MKATSGRKAFEKAFEILGAGVEKDEEATKRAGYPIYRSAKNGAEWVSDLGNRLEVNTANGGTITAVFLFALSKFHGKQYDNFLSNKPRTESRRPFWYSLTVASRERFSHHHTHARRRTNPRTRAHYFCFFL